MGEIHKPEAKPDLHPETRVALALLDKQFVWLESEMNQSRTDNDYRIELERFSRGHSVSGSALDRLSQYWAGFEDNNQALACSDLSYDGRLQSAARSLAFIGKTAAGLADYAGLALWLGHGRQNDHTGDALDRIRQATVNHLSVNPILNYYGLFGEGSDFRSTNMGVRIMAMHYAVRDGIDDPRAYRSAFGSWSETLLESAVGAAVASLCLWQTQVRRLEAMRLRPMMPKPGVLGGDIEVWDSPAANLWS